MDALVRLRHLAAPLHTFTVVHLVEAFVQTDKPTRPNPSQSRSLHHLTCLNHDPQPVTVTERKQPQVILSTHALYFPLNSKNSYLFL